MPEEAPVSPIYEAGNQDSLIAGKDVAFYWKASRLFIVLLVILEIINVVLNRIPYGTWLAVALVSVLFTWWLLRRFRVKLGAVITANIIFGLCSGLLMAIFEIIWLHKWWYALNLIRRPLLLAAVAAIIAGIFYIVFQNIITRNKISEPKGGGIYGGNKT
jgi:hypothetical protein